MNINSLIVAYENAYRKQHRMQIGLYEKQNEDKIMADLRSAQQNLFGIQISPHVKLTYGFILVSVADVARILDCDPHYVMGFYELRGGDVKQMGISLGREITMHRGAPFDKLELGNRYKLPWSQIDEQPNEIQNKLLEIYLKGLFVDKRFTHGQYAPVELSKTRQEEFDTHLKRVIATFRKPPEPTKAEPKVMLTAAAAKAERKKKPPRDPLFAKHNKVKAPHIEPDVQTEHV